jgi:hypothetical protein
MAENQKTETDSYSVDFSKHFPKPLGKFDYRGKVYPAWAPHQLGQAAMAQINGVGAAMKRCKVLAEQYDVIVDAIVALVPTAPAASLKNEPFESLLGAFGDLTAAGATTRPTKAGRKKSGSRRTSAQ